MDCNRTPLKSLPDVTLSLLICLCCNLATNMNEFYVETVKILILDLARELRSSVDVFYVDIAMKAIYSLNDPQLRDQTEMLLNV